MNYIFISLLYLTTILILILFLSTITIQPTRNETISNEIKQIEMRKQRNIQFQPSYKDDIFDLTQFNYSGICNEIFQYPGNNKQDLILYSIGFENATNWLKMKEESHRILTMSQSVIPNARKVLLLLSDIPTESFIDEMKSYGIEVIQPNYNLPNATAVVKRIFAEELFLKEQKESIKRVVIADFRDVLFFNDIFATFGEDDLVLLMECMSLESTNHCRTLRERINKQWMREGYGIETAQLFAQRNDILINGGLFLGGIDKIISLLSIQRENLNKEKLMYWGQDQAALNYIHLTGQLDHLNFTRDYCSQRICFAEMYSGEYDALYKRVISKPSGCSPVARHKLVFNYPKFKYPEDK